MKVPAVHSLSVAGRAPIVAVGLVTGPFASVMLSNSGPNAAPSLPNDCRGNRIFLTPRIAKNGPRTSSHCGPYGLSTASSTPCIVPADSPVLSFADFIAAKGKWRYRCESDHVMGVAYNDKAIPPKTARKCQACPGFALHSRLDAGRRGRLPYKDEAGGVGGRGAH
jgi:hypothetical protein